jgi:glycerate dehydrogenase
MNSAAAGAPASESGPDTRGGVVFLDFDTLDKGDLQLDALRQVAAPLRCFGNTAPDELAGRATDAWCAVSNKVRLGRDFFSARPALRLVCVAATGTNNVDLAAAAEHGVAVVNCRDYCTDSVAQHVLMFVLAFARSLPRYQADVARGAWSRSPFFCLLDHPLRELSGLTLGLIGYGTIGRRVEQLARALGMRIVIAERPGRAPREGRVAFDEAIGRCDFISLHCPLDATTERMIDADVLRRMRKDACLINTARGGLVDEAALLRALREGWIGGAALDVVSAEPPPADDPLLNAGLPNLVVTPHCAWGSREARQSVIDQTVGSIEEYLRGERLSGAV